MVAWYDTDDDFRDGRSDDATDPVATWRARATEILGPIARAVRDGRRTLIGSVLLFGFAGLFATLHVTPEYRATATLQVDGREADAVFRDIETGALLPGEVWARAAVELGLAPAPGTLEHLRAGTTFEARRAARAVAIAFRSADAEAAARTANALADSYRLWRTDQIADGVLRATEDLEARIGDLERRLAELAARTDQERLVETETASARGLIDGFRQRLGALRAEDGAGRLAIRIFEDAETPAAPDWPPTMSVLVASLLIGASVGLGIALRRQRREDRICSPDDLEAALGAPCLATLPALAGGFFTRASPSKEALARDGSSFAIALSSLEAALVLAENARLPKILLFTGPAEETDTAEIAGAFARVAAKSGRRGRVALVGSTAAFAARGRAGVEDFVAGHAGIDDILEHDPASGLFAVRANGKGAAFGTPGFRRLLGELAQRFDLVVVAAPSVRRRADARISAEIADMALVVATWAATPRRQALRCARLLGETGLRLGAVLRGADVARLAAARPAASAPNAGAPRRHYGD